MFGDGVGLAIPPGLRPGTLKQELADFLGRDVPKFLEQKAGEEAVERALRMSKRAGKIFEQFTDPPKLNSIEAAQEKEFLRRVAAELRSQRPELFTELAILGKGEVPDEEDLLAAMARRTLALLIAVANTRPVTPQLAMDRTDP